MSLITERFLKCDGYNCDNNTIDMGREWPNEFVLKMKARASGWYINNKTDFCPECCEKCKEVPEE